MVIHRTFGNVAKRTPFTTWASIMLLQISVILSKEIAPKLASTLADLYYSRGRCNLGDVALWMPRINASLGCVSAR